MTQTTCGAATSLGSFDLTASIRCWRGQWAQRQGTQPSRCGSVDQPLRLMRSTFAKAPRRQVGSTHGSLRKKLSPLALLSTHGITLLVFYPLFRSLVLSLSLPNTAYWATNGIQCTEYEKWLVLAEEAGFNIVLLPLNEHASANFDETKAWLWLDTVLGTDYGYSVMLYSWIDTIKDNYPCTAPDFKETQNSTCLTWEIFEILGPLLDKLVPSLGFGQMFIAEAYAHRLGIRSTDWNSSLPVIYYEAGQKGVDMKTVPTMAENDAWRYHSTKNGVAVDDAHAMVCCVFVCNVWKNAGVFRDVDDLIECGEFTNLDVYSSKVFEVQSPKTGRDPRCIAADPLNPNCQIMGDYTLRLNRANSKPLAKHMNEKCPTTLPGCTAGWNCPTQPDDC